MVLDILSTNNWERPVYFGIGLGSDAYMGLEKYFQLEGAAYRVVPIETKEAEFYDYGRIDSDILYDNIMNKFEWGKYQRSESKHRLLPRSDHRRHEIPEYLPSVGPETV